MAFTRRQKLLNEIMAEVVKTLEKEITKYQEDPYVYIDGMKIKKTLKQCIPYTNEKWAEYLRDKAARDNKQLINFIDKVFFQDGGLQFKETQTNVNKQQTAGKQVTRRDGHIRTDSSTSGRTSRTNPQGVCKNQTLATQNAGLG